MTGALWVNDWCIMTNCLNPLLFFCFQSLLVNSKIGVSVYQKSMTGVHMKVVFEF